ncbi:MAG TPA: type II toxin-antitoxin system VapC family toxin [Rubrobacter sp.]|nr:type II toxin-antitoxin system VapC family toxin [Rubrobacter sp.]
MPAKNVVDSSGWLEYFADGPNADFFEEAIEEEASLVIPSISIYEVFKRLLAEPDGEEAGFLVVAAMQRGEVVDLDAELALDAARISRETRLPMADSIILATAHARDARLWTQDADFEGIEGVEYVRKQK